MADIWNQLVEEYEPLIGAQYRCGEHTYTFFGLVHGGDDYYYGMWQHGTGKCELLSCVGAPESFGYFRTRNATRHNRVGYAEI